MNHERLITAFYYAIDGIILGFGIALFTSFYLSTSFSSAKIILFTIISCFVIGYLFPHCISLLFKSIWRIFVK
ncbi:hypothetical protein D9K81_14480 [Acinetobacter chengduensis]|uniref:Uncharacterized protein n=1 Tax=Acinetobacter chengduensis TaxID=2420890 RepID=A0ABX9TTI3_9GAMM|nr:hypothetical protein D7V31_13705 [Acinetobacter sp. WCHAc060007]RLL19197.1 hypothetical protein D9K81_14480 [Acinetobacter chengduensis]